MYAGVRQVGLQSIYSEIPCSECGEECTVKVQVQGGYFHMIFIPIFSNGKTVVSRCDNCEQYLNYHEMPIDLQIEANELKKAIKVPFWYFSGAISLVLAFVLIFFYSIYSMKNNMAEQAAYFNKPQVGDIYSYEMGTEEYTLLRLDSISDDSIYFNYNEYVVFKSSDLKSLNSPNKFEDIQYGVSKQEVKAMVNEKSFFRVERNK